MISCLIAWLKLGIATDWSFRKVMDTVKLIGYAVIALSLIYIGHRFPMLGSTVGGLVHIAFGVPSEPADADAKPKAAAASVVMPRPPSTPAGAQGTYYLDTGACIYRLEAGSQWQRWNCDG